MTTTSLICLAIALVPVTALCVLLWLSSVAGDGEKRREKEEQ